MTLTETAAALRRLADSFDKVAKNNPGAANPFGHKTPTLDEEQATGAALLLCYIRDLLTNSPRENFPREDLLVLLETISRDGELFPNGAGQLVWQLDDEEI
jgi:hypothetical protein